MSFTLCYSYMGKRVVTRVRVNHMTAYEAICFALVHSGVADVTSRGGWPDSYEGILELAKHYGLTNVSFHRSLKS